MDGKDLLERPIFIVGPGRSGTTLLRTLLSAHSRISIAPETQYLEWVFPKHDIRRAPENFGVFWEKYISWMRFKDLGVDATRCRELVDQQGERTFESIFRAVLTAFGERTGKVRVGEKTPGHVHYLSVLFEWFPEARILITQRDPRAVVASALKTPFSQERIKPCSLRQGVFMANRLHETVHWIDDWKMIYEKIVPSWIGDPRVLAVPYESLVKAPESTLNTICKFFGETFEPAMIDSHSRSHVPTPAGEMRVPEHELWRREHLNKTTQPVNVGSLYKWKQELSQREVALIEGACWKGMQAYGYLPTRSPAAQGGGQIFKKVFDFAVHAEVRARNTYRGVSARFRNE